MSGININFQRLRHPLFYLQRIIRCFNARFYDKETVNVRLTRIFRNRPRRTTSSPSEARLVSPFPSDFPREIPPPYDRAKIRSE